MFLPSKVAKGFGEISPLLLCTRVSSALVLTDPATLRSVQIEVISQHGSSAEVSLPHHGAEGQSSRGTATW